MILDCPRLSKHTYARVIRIRVNIVTMNVVIFNNSNMTINDQFLVSNDSQKIVY